MSGHYVCRIANFYLCLYFWQLPTGLICQQEHLRPIKLNRTVRFIFCREPPRPIRARRLVFLYVQTIRQSGRRLA